MHSPSIIRYLEFSCQFSLLKKIGQHFFFKLNIFRKLRTTMVSLRQQNVAVVTMFLNIRRNVVHALGVLDFWWLHKDYI